VKSLSISRNQESNGIYCICEVCEPSTSRNCKLKSLSISILWKLLRARRTRQESYFKSAQFS